MTKRIHSERKSAVENSPPASEVLDAMTSTQHAQMSEGINEEINDII